VHKLAWLILAIMVATGGKRLLAADFRYPFAESSLSGEVKSQKGESLEGVLVRAKREGTPVAYSVISDAQGKYRFPKLESGKYFVQTVRADGMEPASQFLEIQQNGESHANFSLGPAKNMIEQMSAADWVLNLPGSPAQVSQAQNRCITCHNLYNLMSFRFDQDGWAKIIRTMGRIFSVGGQRASEYYEPLSHRENVQRIAGPGAERFPGVEESVVQQLAEYLAKVRGPEPIDLSHAKILPRPGGRSVRAIFTEYDLPYPLAKPHDMRVDSSGYVWWTDWRWPVLGRLDPKTGEMKTWEAPRLEGKNEAHPDTFQIVFDAEDNPWTALSWSGGLAKFDRKSEQFTKTWTYPDRGPRHITLPNVMDTKRGRIWFGSSDFEDDDGIGFYVPKTGQFTVYPLPPGENGNRNAYGRIIDSKGNAFSLMDGSAGISRVDAETGEITRYSTPTPNSRPRRGDIDAQDRVWFAEWGADQIGMFDPKTNKFTEYKMPIPVAKPYGVNVDPKTGLVWASEWLADRMISLDPRTGEMREYLLPTKDSEVRMEDFYSTGDHSVMWFGALPAREGGKLVKLEAW
jgi:streptogramin lyase